MTKAKGVYAEIFKDGSVVVRDYNTGSIVFQCPKEIPYKDRIKFEGYFLVKEVHYG